MGLVWNQESPNPLDGRVWFGFDFAFPDDENGQCDTIVSLQNGTQISRYQYGSTLEEFIQTPLEAILGLLTQHHNFAVLPSLIFSWTRQIEILKQQLLGLDGDIFLEFDIPRMGHRVDTILLTKGTIYVIEFKVGENTVNRSDIEQVWDYALDLKYFHETSHNLPIVPILIATRLRDITIIFSDSHHDLVYEPIVISSNQLADVIQQAPSHVSQIYTSNWLQGQYKPTPTIVEAARRLYAGHDVKAITRNDAGATNLAVTSKVVSDIISHSRVNSEKSIVFVTGVPGAGKTLVGLDVAIKHSEPENDLHSIYLSGNGPLVKVLTEALMRDQVAKVGGTKRSAASAVRAFIQNVHHFRDECLRSAGPPADHVAIFDEAQRAWNLAKTADFMNRKRGIPDFQMSEPEFLISCLDRHSDWATIVCLVGGGQEINTGEAGIIEWIAAIKHRFPDWVVYVSDELLDSEHNPCNLLPSLLSEMKVSCHCELHLSASIRSFRSERVSEFVKKLLDREACQARTIATFVLETYPIVLCRDIVLAKTWLRGKSRGSERIGIVVSSNAERLKASGVFVKAPVDPVHWFLEESSDVRSSNFLEDVVTEFDVQGLELDWTCVVWDADFRFGTESWGNFEFRGHKWQQVKKSERQSYQKNAYRVLLTRARQGMVIVVPHGERGDPTRIPQYYDTTYNYLVSLGLPEITPQP